MPFVDDRCYAVEAGYNKVLGTLVGTLSPVNYKALHAVIESSDSLDDPITSPIDMSSAGVALSAFLSHSGIDFLFFSHSLFIHFSSLSKYQETKIK